MLGARGPRHHFASAGGVEREHANRQARYGLNGLGDGVGNVVEFEVEKDVEAEVGDFTDAVGAGGGEHLEADFRPADGALELAERGGDVARGGRVEGENEVARHEVGNH